MEKITNFIKENTLGILVFVSLGLNIAVLANVIIPSNSVSYTNSKTNETTVEGSLNELFDAVNINERLGSTDISSIGNGTITGAINSLNNSLIYNGINPTTMVIENIKENTTVEYILEKDSWLQFNLEGKGSGTAVLAKVNNIVVYGIQHISGDTYNSVYARKGDVISITTVGNAIGRVYMQ